MKRYVAGLAEARGSRADDVPDGILLVRVERAQHHWPPHKAFLSLVLSVLEPKHLAGARLPARLHYTKKTLWKLNWFLRDFGYDADLLERNEVEEKQLVGLCGVVKVTHDVVSGASVLNLNGFAPRDRWKLLCADDRTSDGRASS